MSDVKALIIGERRQGLTEVQPLGMTDGRI